MIVDSGNDDHQYETEAKGLFLKEFDDLPPLNIIENTSYTWQKGLKAQANELIIEEDDIEKVSCCFKLFPWPKSKTL